MYLNLTRRQACDLSIVQEGGDSVREFPRLSLAPPVWVTTGGACAGAPVLPAHRAPQDGAMADGRGQPPARTHPSSTAHRLRRGAGPLRDSG